MIKPSCLLLVWFILLPLVLVAQRVTVTSEKAARWQVFTMQNEQLSFRLVFQDEKLHSDSLLGSMDLLGPGPQSARVLASDGGFQLELMWSGWRAPGKDNNGDNLILLDAAAFTYKRHEVLEQQDGSKTLRIRMVSPVLPLQLDLSYRLSPGDFFVKKKIDIQDTAGQGHFLESVSPVNAKYQMPGGSGSMSRNLPKVLNKGGFGQPLAFSSGSTGVFAGIEHVAGNSSYTLEHDAIHIRLQQDIGEIVTGQVIGSDWSVLALCPGQAVQSYFYDYLDHLRAAPAEPYTLYNSWYDLRSPEYPGVQPDHVMNETNALRIIDLLKKNMVERHGIQLDAFVLDDGWDVYESDWARRAESFPNAFKPLTTRLKEMNTALGLWYGPSGGYSFRMKRIDWMKQQAYETLGQGRDHAMLCLGGEKYSKLFESRVVDNVKKDGITYFKWDGIQFSCNETGHGHPAGKHSRRAILGSLISKCNTVRALNPKMYLNITSGTWLSPWWVKHANQIWMDGGDYGFADVPSRSSRDAAITYRDLVLHDDLIKKNLWFPMANLMTHGIIKGKLESVGGDFDPIDIFTNDVVLYFARGISMHELYVSPDVLSDAEWDAIGLSIKWARENKAVLGKTFMSGGDPGRGECYAYVHYKGNKGIIAARNPVTDAASVKIRLDPAHGLDANASNLVIEKIYPYRFIYPRLYSVNEVADLILGGFETAVFEIYPLETASYPLPAGTVFKLEPMEGQDWKLLVADYNPNTLFLNPASLLGMQWQGKPLITLKDLPQVRKAPAIRLLAGTNKAEGIRFQAREDAAALSLSILLKPARDEKIPEITLLLDGKEVKAAIEKEEGKWCWLSLDVAPGEHQLRLVASAQSESKPWAGSAEVWARIEYPSDYQEIILKSTLVVSQKTNLPLPTRANHRAEYSKLSEVEVVIE